MNRMSVLGLVTILSLLMLDMLQYYCNNFEKNHKSLNSKNDFLKIFDTYQSNFPILFNMGFYIMTQFVYNFQA